MLLNLGSLCLHHPDLAGLCLLSVFFFLGFLPCHFDSSWWCCSVTNLCPTLCNLMDCSTPGLPVLHHLPDFAQIHVNRVNDAIQPSHPLLPTSPPVLNIPSIRVFSNESHQVAKVLEFQLQHQSFQWIFRVDFLWDWLVWSPCCSRDSKESSQHHNLKASIIQCSAFFMVQLLHLYMTTGKTIALTRCTFVSKVMSLLFNMLSRFIIAFLPKSKCLLISWLQSLSMVILEPKKIKSVTVSTFPPYICHEVLGLNAIILVFLMLSFFF